MVASCLFVVLLCVFVVPLILFMVLVCLCSCVVSLLCSFVRCSIDFPKRHVNSHFKQTLWQRGPLTPEAPGPVPGHLSVHREKKEESGYQRKSQVIILCWLISLTPRIMHNHWSINMNLKILIVQFYQQDAEELKNIATWQMIQSALSLFTVQRPTQNQCDVMLIWTSCLAPNCFNEVHLRIKSTKKPLCVSMKSVVSSQWMEKLQKVPVRLQFISHCSLPWPHSCVWNAL